MTQSLGNSEHGTSDDNANVLDNYGFPEFCPFTCDYKCTTNSIFFDLEIALVLCIITICISSW